MSIFLVKVPEATCPASSPQWNKPTSIHSSFRTDFISGFVHESATWLNPPLLPMGPLVNISVLHDD